MIGQQSNGYFISPTSSITFKKIKESRVVKQISRVSQANFTEFLVLMSKSSNNSSKMHDKELGNYDLRESICYASY